MDQISPDAMRQFLDIVTDAARETNDAAMATNSSPLAVIAGRLIWLRGEMTKLAQAQLPIAAE